MNMKKIYFNLLVVLLSLPMAGWAQEPCTPHEQFSNNFQSKGFMEEGGQWLANDFKVSANTLNFEAQRITANLWSQGGIESVDVVFYEDDGGKPGAVFGDTLTDVVPTSQEIIGTAEEFDVHDVVVDFPTSVNLPGTGTSPVTYWVQLIALPNDVSTNVGWEVTFEGVIGEGVRFSNPTASVWYVEENIDGVFALSGECTLSEGCLIPENVQASNVTTNSAEISWDGWPTAENYVLEYGPAGFELGQGTEIVIDGSTTTAILEGLDHAGSYDVYVKTVCAEGESIFTVPFRFMTEDLYCDIDVLVIIEPITYLSFAGIENVTPPTLDASPGHAFHLDMLAQVEAGATYPIIAEGNTGGDYTNGFTAFFDWNQDGVFNGTDERYDIGTLTNSNGEDGQQVTADITVPENAAEGATRMRVIKQFYANQFPLDGCTYISYGQIQDFTVEVSIPTSTVDFESHDFSFGPNPTTDAVQLSASTPIQKVSVFNALGQNVLTQDLRTRSPRLDLSGFDGGVYFMEVTIDGERKTFKVVKE